MDQQSVNRLREELSKITMWLAKDAQVARYFNTRYEGTSAEYKENALGKDEESSGKGESGTGRAAAGRADRGSSGAEVDS